MTPVRAHPERAEAGTPLYLHLPFCAAKCHYCDFYSVVAEGQDLDGTIDALIAEAERRAPRAPRSVFLGGGTPSYFSRAQLARLLDSLERSTGFRASAREVTLESNPESLDADKARALVDLGVTRLTIGVQSLRPEVLRLFGRVHDVATSFAAYEAARSSGAREVGLDLIYAVPGEEPEHWAADLERVLALGADHLSLYTLAFEEETPFHRWLEEGRLARLDEERELELFRATRARLAAAGYDGYEVSNFALNGARCRHNVNYWRNGAYVGIGPSAVSHVGGTRAGNERSLRAWRHAVAAGEPALAWQETLAPLARLGETWWLGLRLAEGVDPRAARRTAGIAPESADGDPALALAGELTGMGLLERAVAKGRGPRFRLTARGLELADAVATRFLAACAPAEAVQ
jgi:oxygen-independent coproporphyrinogen-3 oxidase